MPDIYQNIASKINFINPTNIKKRKKLEKLSRFLSNLALISAFLGIVLIILAFLPSVWYEIASGGSQKISRFLVQSVGQSQKVKQINPVSFYEPQFNPRLSKDNTIKIPSIRIETKILEASQVNVEDALKKGVWRVPDFAIPPEQDKPTILAAHRYGYLAWSIPYRLKNSFYNLPKLKIGSTVEVVWKQRKYIYEVYAEDKGENISDYSADLILYTCESLNSPVRIFKYSRLLKI